MAWLEGQAGQTESAGHAREGKGWHGRYGTVGRQATQGWVGHEGREAGWGWQEDHPVRAGQADQA